MTLRRARAELAAMPPGTVRDVLVRRMVDRHIDRKARRATDRVQQEEEDEVMRQLPFVEELERRCRDEGRTEGAVVTIARVVERRLARDLSSVEHAALAAWVAPPGHASKVAPTSRPPVPSVDRGPDRRAPRSRRGVGPPTANVAVADVQLNEPEGCSSAPA